MLLLSLKMRPDHQRNQKLHKSTTVEVKYVPFVHLLYEAYDATQVEKLFENPEREVQLPTGARERTLRAPVEMMKNVQGSSAGAGSGEFHVYKQSRRREYERLKIMTDKTRAVSRGPSSKTIKFEADSYYLW
jgi:hypothetical protein